MKKTKLYLDEAEWQAMIHALNDLRTEYIRQNRDTCFLDGLIVKIINAPIKRLKIA